MMDDWIDSYGYHVVDKASVSMMITCCSCRLRVDVRGERVDGLKGWFATDGWMDGRGWGLDRGSRARGMNEMESEDRLTDEYLSCTHTS